MKDGRYELESAVDWIDVSAAVHGARTNGDPKVSDDTAKWWCWWLHLVHFTWLVMARQNLLLVVCKNNATKRAQTFWWHPTP